MGRHSIPGPDDSSPEPVEDSADADRADPAGPVDFSDYGPGSVAAGMLDGGDDEIDPARYLRRRGFPADDEPVRQPAGTAEVPAGYRGGRRWQVGDQWRGFHRSQGGRRGVSVGVVAALVAVILMVGTVILWRFFGDSLSQRSEVAAGRCVAGELAVPVVADPSIADHLQQFAERFTKSAKPVADRCVSVHVTAVDADGVVSGLAGDWPAQLGERPALWVPGSSASTARLQAAAGAEAVSDARSLVTSPVLLAVRPEIRPALQRQTWATLPELQRNPDGLSGAGLPGWGSLRLALPIDGNADAALLAAEAVAATAAPPGAPAEAGTGAVRTLAGAQPELPDRSVAAAMNALLRPGDPAGAPVHAVVTTEQQLFARGKTLQDAGDTLASWLAPGPVPVADYPTVLLNGPWLAAEQVSAASEFARFVRKPDQLAELAGAGFRVEGISPPASEVTDFAAVPATLTVGDAALRATLAGVMTAPAADSTVTIMLDRSMTTDEGGRTRLANVIAALNRRIESLPAGCTVGLWAFDGVEGRSLVAAGPLRAEVNGQPRTAALTAALDGLSSTPGGAVSFTTLRLVYGQALSSYVAGQSNSALVITAGPHTDQTLDGAGLQDYLRANRSAERPVAVNVITVGADPDQSTWQAVAQLTGGRYQNVAGADSPDLAGALGAVLG